MLSTSSSSLFSQSKLRAKFSKKKKKAKSKTISEESRIHHSHHFLYR
ncbi:hypothetical protein LINPERPRIM_LOCUS25658 [Linum perenne]